MRTAIFSTTASLAIIVFLSLMSAQCKKTVETKRDTITVRDTTIVKTDTSINLSKGLLVYYPFNNNTNDLSGNQRNGVISGTLQYTTDKSSTANSAAQFNGSTYISITDNGGLSPSSFTVCGQFYATTTSHQNVFSKINYSNANSIAWGLALFGNAPGYEKSASFAVRGTSVACGSFDPVSYSDLVYSMEDIKVNQWYHVACVFDKGVQKIYLNGTLRHAFTRDFQTPKQCTDAAVILGAWYTGSPLFFNGKIDEFRMYNRALNDMEIAQLGKGF